MLAALAVFAGAAGALVLGAVMLTRSAEELAERTGWGQLGVGMVLLAVVTSLPEVVTNTTAVLEGLPDMAVGGLLGSSMANMASLAAVDLISRRRVWPAVDLGHARLGAVVVGLLAIAGLGIATEDLPALGWVGSETVFIAISYVGAIAWVHRSSKGRLVPGTAPLYEPTPVAPGRLATLPGVLGRFLAAAAVIALAAPFVVGATERFAGAAGLGHAFAGAAMLATASALPELVVSVAAVRLGAANLAVGNLLGSAAFNMALLAPLDAVFTGGPLLAAASSAHLVTAFVAMFMVAVSQAGIVHGTETRIRRAEPDALLVLAAYAVGLALLARAA